MNLSTKTLAQIPPIVALDSGKITISGSRRDIHAWLKADSLRFTDAFIIHDPCGCLLKRYRNVLSRNGYGVKVFDTTCGAESARYNPFSYIRDSGGVKELADAVMRGTQGSGDGDDYGFYLAEWLLLRTLFEYIHEYAPEDEWNFNTALDMIKSMEIIGDLDDDYVTAVDCMFESLERRDPYNPNVLRYKHFKTTPYSKDNKLLDSCAERLAPLVTKQALDLMSEDELCFNEWSYSKTALFVRTDVNCSHLKFITPLMYSQFFGAAYEQTVY